MECIICNSSMRFFVSKKFQTFKLDIVDYWRCENCGFTISKTHADMSPSAWESLDHDYHPSYQGKEFNPNDPWWIARLLSQANILYDATQIGLLDGRGRWLDYGCGDGKLSNILSTQQNLRLLKYDRYMPAQEDFLKDGDLMPRGFDFVITTSVFEHLRRREQLDFVESLVSDNGVFAIHTLVCENVPRDASWFYLVPLHCTFHTNKSMSLLLQQWGYTSSVYNVGARLWLCFKSPRTDVEARIQQANNRPHGPFYVYKQGFVDYWKGEPLRKT